MRVKVEVAVDVDPEWWAPLTEFHSESEIRHAVRAWAWGRMFHGPHNGLEPVRRPWE